MNNTGWVNLNDESVDKEEETFSDQYSSSVIPLNSKLSSDDDEDASIVTKVITINQVLFEEYSDLEFENSDMELEVDLDTLSISFGKPANDTS